MPDHPLAMPETIPNDSPGAGLHECCICSLQFESTSRLRHHRTARHSALSFRFNGEDHVVAPGENGYVCPLGNCSQPYRNRDGLQRHLRKHHDVNFSNGIARAANPPTLSGEGAPEGTMFDQPVMPPRKEPTSCNSVRSIPCGQPRVPEAQGFSDGGLMVGPLGLGHVVPANGTSSVPDQDPKGNNAGKMELATRVAELISAAVTNAVLQAFESMRPTAYVPKKAVELNALSEGPVLTGDTVIADLSPANEQQQVRVEKNRPFPSSPLSNSPEQETRECNRGSEVTRGPIAPLTQSSARAADSFETTPPWLDPTGSLLGVDALEPCSEVLYPIRKREREEAAESFTPQGRSRSLKRLRSTGGNGTEDESEGPQSLGPQEAVHNGYLEPDPVGGFTASYPHGPTDDSREENHCEDSPSDSDADADTDFDADEYCDNEVEMGLGKVCSPDISFAAEESLYTRNVLSERPESEETLRFNVRGAMEHITGLSATREKSEAQMLGILLVLRAQTDAIITIRTGGGKSMLWMVPPLLKEDVRFLVVCPYRVLLDEQCEKARGANIRASNFTHSKRIPPDVQILFIQVEHIGSKELDTFLSRTDRPKFTHLFIDECHDILTCPNDRLTAWRTFTEWAGALSIPIFLLSATIPPALQKKLLKKYNMRIHDIAIVRSPTNRPEIGLHTINVAPHFSDYSLFQLVDGLERRLTENERMLVYTYSRPQAERLAVGWNCAVYHSSLPLQGNTKDYNLDRWDRGETKVMVCTSAFGSGVDRPNIRFVVIYDPALDLLTTAQMLGRAGRDGTPSHAFFVPRGPAVSCAKPSRSDQLPRELSDIVHKKLCKVYQLMRHLDGEDFPKTCAEIPGQLPCDICEPNNAMHQFATRAVQNPHRPTHTLRTYSLTEHSRASLQLRLPASPIPWPSSTLNFTEPAKKKLPATHSIDGTKNGNSAIARTATTILSQQEPRALEVSSQAQRGPPRSASLPNLSGPGLRAAASLAVKEARFGRTKDLDRYMSALKGKCSYHFVTKAEVVPDHFPDCPYFVNSGGEYDAFKRKFVFERFSYCFSCGMPQDRNRNGEGPTCHAGVPYGKGCTFGSFIFRAVFCIWQDLNLRDRMRRDLGIAESLSSCSAFADWATSEQREQGKYHNCLEAFLWFCDVQEKRNPRLFLQL